MRRQLAAFVVVAVVFGVIAFFFASRFLPSPTCFDNRKNQGELGVDCGGPCGPCELKNPKSLTVFWTRLAHADSGVYDAVALVENPNEVLSSPSLQYEFAFFDATGEIGRRTGSTFIFPQERIYVVEPDITLSREPVRVEFKIISSDWQVGQVVLPILVVENRQYRIRETAGRRQSAVEATIANTSPFDFRRMETSVVVLDKDGNVMGANRVVNENIGAGSTIDVLSLWPSELSGDAATIEVRPRVNVLAPDTVIRPQ